MTATSPRRRAPAVAEEVRDARPDILFVAISSPRKEYWLGRYGRAIDVPFVMGVGGAIDVVAGITSGLRAPLQRLGLEWAYRLAQEPRRLWRRYAMTNLRFGLLLAGALVAAGYGRGAPAVAAAASSLSAARSSSARSPASLARENRLIASRRTSSSVRSPPSFPSGDQCA